MADGGIGESVLRKEDFRFLTGAGTYTDDVNRPGQCHAVLVRSPHAHAKIVSIDTKVATSAPGVLGQNDLLPKMSVMIFRPRSDIHEPLMWRNRDYWRFDREFL